MKDIKKEIADLKVRIQELENQIAEPATIKCNVKALVLLDGCMTCTNCGDSKCG